MTSILESINIHLYKKAFLVSALLFLLYSFVSLIELDNYILNFNVLNVELYKRGTLIYTYISAYYVLLLKIIIALFTLFIIILIIRIAVITIIRIFIKSKKQSGGATQIINTQNDDISNNLMEAVISNIRWLLSFIVTDLFIIIFLILIPLFLFFVLLVYSRFYDQNNIKENNLENSQKILLTQHNYLSIILTFSFFIGFFYLIINIF